MLPTRLLPSHRFDSSNRDLRYKFFLSRVLTSQIRLFVYLFVYSFIRSFIHSFIHSFVRIGTRFIKQKQRERCAIGCLSNMFSLSTTQIDQGGRHTLLG